MAQNKSFTERVLDFWDRLYLRNQTIFIKRIE